MKNAPATSSASPRGSPPPGSPALPGPRRSPITPAVSPRALTQRRVFPRSANRGSDVRAARAVVRCRDERPGNRRRGAHAAQRGAPVVNDGPEEVTSREAPPESGVELDGRDVYWFVGGPLDGRVHTRAPDDPPPPVVRHTHLHEGPKIVHYYDLHEVAGHGGEYRLSES